MEQIITANQIKARRRASELAVIQTLKHRGEFNVLRSLSECRRVYGKDWIDNAIKRGQLSGVHVGKRVLYSVEDIVALQEIELEEADIQVYFSK